MTPTPFPSQPPVAVPGLPAGEKVAASIVALERFQVEIRTAAGREEILGVALAHLHWLLPIRTAGFFFPTGPDQEFSLRTPLESAAAARLNEAVDHAIEAGRFGWALRHLRPALFTEPDREDALILGALRTRRRVLGMFAALVKPDYAAGWNLHLPIVATYLASAANAILSEELTLELQTHNRKLDGEVQQRTQELQHTAAELDESRRIVAGAAAAAQILLSGRKVTVVLPELARALGEALRVAHVGVELRPEPDAAAGGVSRVFSWVRSVLQTPPEAAPPLPERWRRELEAGQPVAAPTPDMTADEGEFLRRTAATAVLLLPIRTADTFWGVLRLDSDAAGRSWSNVELRTLQTVADNLGLVLRREQHERQLEAAKQAAEAASVAKDRFLATISHELRTPLNAILGNAQTLHRHEGLAESVGAQVTAIQLSADHLLALINDLLDLSKAEATRIELDVAPTNLRKLVADAAAILRPRAHEKGLSLTCIVERGVPETLRLDAPRLRQVLINLLGNAVKFTATGTVELRIGRPEGNIRFCVSDTGPGIRAEEISRLGRPFQQLGHESQRGEGSGLGLAISKRILTAMGCELQVESQPGLGSNFWFELPDPSTTTHTPFATPDEDWSLHFQPAAQVIHSAPDPARLRRVRDLAERGDALELQRELTAWTEAGPAAHPLAEQLLPLARGFRIKAIRQVLDQIPYQ